MAFNRPSVLEQLLARFRQWIVHIAGKKSIFLNVFFFYKNKYLSLGSLYKQNLSKMVNEKRGKEILEQCDGLCVEFFEIISCGR